MFLPVFNHTYAYMYHMKQWCPITIEIQDKSHKDLQVLNPSLSLILYPIDNVVSILNPKLEL